MRQERYNTVSIILHWVIALGILAQIAMGLVMANLAIPIGLKFTLYQLHKSIGITLLLAILLRVVWRFTYTPPALPETMPALERRAAWATHLALYVLMIALPFTGWALVSVSPYNIPTVLYGFVPLPDLPVFATLANKQAASTVMTFIHSRLAFILIALLALHIAAALRHHFLLRDGILLRMIPFLPRR